MRKPIQFIGILLKHAFRGSRLYFGWIALLTITFLVGVAAYIVQLREGLAVTNMTDQVSWGAYIANFTFLVGLAAAGVMVVIPAYVYKNKALKKVVWIGEFLAIAAVLMCIMFVTVDLGRPDQMWHLIPFIGKLNWPMSILSWDIIVLSGYLVINVFLITYAMYSKYHGGHPRKRFYIPIVFISMFWAVSIHTVTAFLYDWLGARPFWNSALVPARFLASAFVAGPAFLVLSLQIIDKYSGFSVPQKAIDSLRRIMAVMMVVNLFFFSSEIFTELFTGSGHAASAIYLLGGLEGRHLLVPYIWSAVALNIFAAFVFSIPKLALNRRLLNVACVAAFIGVWIEKGMGLVIPGFIPSPLGEMAEYQPSVIEGLVSAGIWAFGMLAFTLSVKVGAEIERGSLYAEGVIPDLHEYDDEEEHAGAQPETGQAAVASMTTSAEVAS